MFELRRSLRRIKPHRFTQQVRRRPSTELPFVPMSPAPGQDLLLDTCVYIDVMKGDTPPEVDALLTLRTSNHLAICVAELTHGFGRLDPGHPGTAGVLRTIAHIVAAIPSHRLETAASDVVIEAGILAGLLFRLCGLQTGQEVAALNDAIIYLHAMANGQTVLTRNVRDFDIMNQILPDGRILFYNRID
jgi:predicted nucleic acid-binding protein